MKIVQVIIINVIIVKNPIKMGFFIDNKWELSNQEEKNVALSEKKIQNVSFFIYIDKILHILYNLVGRIIWNIE